MPSLRKTGLAIYSGASEKRHRQAFEQSPLFKGLREKSHAVFWESGYRTAIHSLPAKPANSSPTVAMHSAENRR